MKHSRIEESHKDNKYIFILVKYKKIRGHKRRLKQIEHWRHWHLTTDLKEILKHHENHYAKIRIYPWNGFTAGNSITPEPKGSTKLAMLNGLFDIYNNWKQQLDKIGKPYYLKIWLYEPHFSKSQVVCAINEKLDFYEDTFLEGKENKKLDASKYGSATEQLEKLTWNHCIEEEHYQNNFVGNIDEYSSPQDFYKTRRWFNRILKKPHRTTPYDERTADCFEFYSFKAGNVWVGGKN